MSQETEAVGGMPACKWYFEDFEAGKSFEIGSRSVTEEEILRFAREFDPQPFHVDHGAAAQSIYGGIIASGLHTCSIMMRLMVDGLWKDTASLGSPGFDRIRWIKPVRGGDTLSVRMTVVESRPSDSKPDRGIVVNRWEARNQHGELVAEVQAMALLGRRPANSVGSRRHVA